MSLLLSELCIRQLRVLPAAEHVNAEGYAFPAQLHVQSVPEVCCAAASAGLLAEPGQGLTGLQH